MNPPKTLTYKGETRTLAEWAQKLGCPKKNIGKGREALRGRLRLGWSVRDVVTTPIRKWEAVPLWAESEDDR